MNPKIFLHIIFCFFVSISSACAKEIDEFKTIQNDLKMFNSPMALELKKGFKKKNIKQIKNIQLRELASQLFNKSYNSEYRSNIYHAVYHPKELGRDLWIGDGYSKYENVTGIYLSKGKHIVLVDMKDNDEVSLVVPNWLRMPPNELEPTKDPNGWGLHQRSFPLKNGLNVIELKEWDGLAYIQYFKKDKTVDKSIKIHFPAASVNGYFDIAKHNDQDWNRLLDKAIYPIIDGLGKHIQIAYPVEACKKYAENKGVELINNYDSLVYLQHKLMGLVKYNRVPENRILSRVNYNYYMFRDSDGVAYMGGKSGYAMHLVVDPKRMIKGDPCWGFAHEVGHVHQLRPYFNWGGLGEVSNNVFSLYVNTHFGTKSRIQSQKNYQSSRDKIINNKISYLEDDDVFNRLVPFWQLHLYFAKVLKQPDFYPDLFEALRVQGDVIRKENKEAFNDSWGNRGNNPAEYQLNFVLKACEVSKTDLSDFFDQYGFFKVGQLTYDDYGKYTYKMTQEMVDQCKSKIKSLNLPKPKVDISTLTDENTI